MKHLAILFVLSITFFWSCSENKKEQTITMEWLYSDEGKSVGSIYKAEWIDNNSLYLMDMRKPKEDRTILKLDPNSPSEMISLIDNQKLVKELTSIINRDDTTMFFDWQKSFSSSGQYGLYIYEGDIFILDINSSKFLRITDTPIKEKSARFSPDGKNIAFIRENDLYTYNIKKKQEKRLTYNDSETILNGTVSWVYWEEIFGRQDIGYWWSDDSKAIAYLQTDESPVTKMHYVHWEPEEPKLITQRYPKAGTANPIVKLGIIEISTPKTKWVDLESFEYLCRVKWLPDNKRLSIQTMNRAQTKLDLFFVDRATGKNIDKIITETDSGYAHLYQFSYDGTLLNQITDGSWALRSSGGPFWLRQSVVNINEEKETIYFTSLKESSIERHLYRSSIDGKTMEKISAQEGVHKISFSKDGKYYIDIHSDTKSPPTLVLYNNNGKRLHTLVDHRTDIIENYSLQTPELFTIPTKDNFLMPAQILKPKNFVKTKKYPIIFHVYGGPSAPTVFNQWQGQSLFYDNMLLEMGYLIVKFDHRAATAKSKKLENRVLNMMSGPIEREDIVDGIKWLKSQSYIDTDRVGIWGWSGGGSFTLNLMTNTKEFKAGVSVAPVTDWHYYDTKWAEFAMKRPIDNPEGYENTSFVKSAKNLHGTLLLVHGTYDDNVHPQNSWHFIDELVKANIQFDMMFYPMRKHGIADDPARIHLYNKMLEFWSENL